MNDLNELHFVEAPSQFVPTRGERRSPPGVGRGSATLDHPSRVDSTGFAVVRDRLHDENQAKPDSALQFDRLVAVLQSLLHRLESCFGVMIDRAMAVGEWSRIGTNLRGLPDEDSTPPH